MIPSILSQHVCRGVADFLRTTFPVSTPFFREVLERLLAEEGGVFKGPYLSIQLPFVSGRGDREFFEDVGMKYRPHLHQERAFERLSSKRSGGGGGGAGSSGGAVRGARSTIIATGTGSGKTECFLYPILDHCLRNSGEPGVKAILIYPMNALATDQAGRIAETIWENKRLRGRVTAGLFVGQSTGKESKVMTRTGVITDKETQRLRPPDILLTNYKMLDYLLVRPRDYPLWQGNGPETLRYLVVDELHTFDGAQGTDLACLIRRLKARLKVPEGYLCCVGTSATLGEGDGRGGDVMGTGDGSRESKGKWAGLREYAEAVFGERFDDDSVIAESRMSAGEFLGDTLISRVLVVGRDKAEELDPARYDDYEDYVRAQIDLWLDGSAGNEGLEGVDWRVELGEGLKGNLFFQNLLKALGGRSREIDELLDQLEKVTPDMRGRGRGSDGEQEEHEGHGSYKRYRENVLNSLLSLVSEARVKTEGGGVAPFLHMRVQLWLRELRRMVGSVKEEPRLCFADDLNEDQVRLHLPLVHCRECGVMGWAGMKRSHDTVVESDLKSFYVGFFAFSPRVVFLFPDDRREAPKGIGMDVELKRLCGGCLHLWPREKPGDSGRKGENGENGESGENGERGKIGGSVCAGCGSRELIDVIVPVSRKQVKKTKRYEGVHNCPYCGSNESLTVLGSRAASLTSVLIAQLFSSQYNKDKKLLTFSDSVQDAAYRAGFFAARTYRFNFRAALQQFIMSGGEGLRLSEMRDGFVEYWTRRMGYEEKFAATFLAPDMAWLEEYEGLLKKGKLRKGSRLRGLVEKRIDWEITSEYGFRTRIGRTLEKTSSSVAYVDMNLLERVVEKTGAVLRNELGGLRKLGEKELYRFLLGMVVHLKNQGGIDHPGLERYVEDGGNTFVVNRMIDWMPSFGRRGRAPVFLCSGSSNRFERLLSGSGTHRTWHQAWLDKCFDMLDPMISAYADRVYEIALKGLVDEGILSERVLGGKGRKGMRVWGLKREALRVSGDVAQFRCALCDHNVSVAGVGGSSVGVGEAWFWEGARCLRFHCRGQYERRKKGEDYYGKLYSQGDVERIFAEEHTGLLTREEREEIERRFKARNEDVDGAGTPRKPWYPNLLSCTPTLEMGIDIGDLSSLILCSVPPSGANYLQRIGRAGRRDGKALNLTVANANPHDLYFFADPEEMIAGRIEPPGVYLDASAVLERQLTAFCFDRWVESGVSAAAVPGVLGPVLENLGKGERFPYDFLEFIRNNRGELLREFLEMFALSPDKGAGKDLVGFIQGGIVQKGRVGSGVELEKQGKEIHGHGAVKDGAVNEEDGNDRECGGNKLEFRILEALQRMETKRRKLRNKIKVLDTRIKAKREENARSKGYDGELSELRQEKAALNELASSISKFHVFNFFTDEGLLPNYTFPEAGVVLRSVIYRKIHRVEEKKGEGEKGGNKESGKGGDKRYDTWEYTYARAARAGLTELAPDNVFYAGGRRVRVDQVNMDISTLETWRLCRECSYAERMGVGEESMTCPRCGDTMWSDAGQKRKMLRMREVLATTADKRSRITDDGDDREPMFYNRQMLADFEDKHVSRAYKVNDPELPFGFEFLSRCVFRDVNFGTKGDIGANVKVAGVEIPRNGFTICRHCGKVQDRQGEIRHALTCTARNLESNENLNECVYLYREFASEAIRVLLPVTAFSGSEKTLHSFVAALHLGLKRRFRGNIDHLQTTLQEEPVSDSALRKQYLVLYDTVPGGTGYLKQLMLTGDQLMQVFDEALTALNVCGCNRDPNKDGCYLCLFAYRHSYDMKETSREEAKSLFCKILAHRGKLEEIERLRDIPIDLAVESMLEGRFLRELPGVARAVIAEMGATVGATETDAVSDTETSGVERVERVGPVVWRQDVVNNKTGYYLKLGSQAYRVGLQVELGPSQGVSVPCRADFVFYPARERPGMRPIAVFTDGFGYHKNRIGRDTAQRMALVQSGKFWVWSLSWKDVVFESEGYDAPYGAFHEPSYGAGDIATHRGFNGTRPRFFKDYLDPNDSPQGHNFERFASHYGVADMVEIVGKNNFEWFVRFLCRPDPEFWGRSAFVCGLTWLDPARLAPGRDEGFMQKWMENVQRGFTPEIADALCENIENAVLEMIRANAVGELKGEREGETEGETGEGESTGNAADPVTRWISVSREDVAEARWRGMKLGCRLDDGGDNGADDSRDDSGDGRGVGMKRGEFERAWIGYLRMYNLFQFLPSSFFVTATGMSRGEYAGIVFDAFDSKVDEVEAAVVHPWRDVLEELDPDAHGLADKLAEAGWPAPEMPPYELVDDRGATTAEAELGWPELKIAILDDEHPKYRGVFERAGWTVVFLSDAIKDPEAVLSIGKSEGS